ncbi:MAG: hypothetical protein VX776_04425 [Planctomycetota bacterium]|nr:hypothetical protein [Planctomycetota bacterium]
MYRIKYLPLLLLLTASLTHAGASPKKDRYKITRPPAYLNLSDFYTKHVSASGYPVVGSNKVNDYALKEAAFLIDLMLAHHPKLREIMIANKSRCVVMAHNEYTTDIPEHRHFTPKEYWDARARGLGGSEDDPVCSVGEENVLSFKGDPYHAECILIHEFAHNMHLRGLIHLDPTFDKRLKQSYEDALASGLWKTKYASVNHHEYWAEGVQSWFSNNRPPDHDHNFVDTRKELIEYDPGLANLCREVFGDTKLVYTRAPTRLRGHLKGYKPGKAPVFVWPEHLQKKIEEIRNAARQRE